MASAIELMCPGVPVTACATMYPRLSKTPAERSPASRTIEVNDVRCSAAACSLTTPISRLQQISSVTGSSARAHGMCTTRVRPSSTRQLAPGPMTAVDSRSSTMAGPAKVAPGPSA